MYETDKTAYTALRDYQEKIVPQILAAVNLDITPPEVEGHVKPSALYQIKRILLEYLEGFGLATLEKRAPQSSWQDIVDQAVNIVHVLSDNRILNADVRPDNFVIVPCGEKRYRVFIFDLAQCRLGREDESDMDCGRAKWTQDEEGAIGFVMKRRLGKLGFELVVNHSQRYLEFAEREE
ncbi:hypothetical protein QBC33DRAFT_593705 [Phialemonium atrogriseum]|uniref:Protein kinase domain-containing protein n=1 Tax=Phialemonium atrogriseum TaxID=1093897 RepID=A0AAJ0BVC5_9PEZI|nr:uncharacterized protein QBC33DRAFT_593705 [Phialemonium atrogriseum]KAK1764941.1 hypothetical protein QBC33DRAFT_593705 [Phialemonium atrogriseum]